MIKIENAEIFGIEGAIRGMRNPMNSWDKSDSFECQKHMECFECLAVDYNDSDCQKLAGVGDNDMDLMRRLFKAGTEHRKYLRMIHVQMDIVAPLYWWKEFDTYKVGTTANSCSTMHKIQAKEFKLDDFSHEHLNDAGIVTLRSLIERLNLDRRWFNENKDKEFWWQMIQLLPSSYNQRRTIDMNYETVMNIIKQRKGHKLDEWHILVDELMKLPYIAAILDVDND